MKPVPRPSSPAQNHAAPAEAATPAPRAGGVFRQAVDAEKHYFDFAAFLFRITAWWTAFGLLLSETLSSGPGLEEFIPVALGVDLGIPLSAIAFIGLMAFAVYGLVLMVRLWVVLAKLRDGLFPPQRTPIGIRFLTAFVAFSAVTIGVLLAVLSIIRALR